MKQKESKKLKYACPSIKIIGIEIEYLMIQGSGNHSGIEQGGVVESSDESEN